MKYRTRKWIVKPGWVRGLRRWMKQKRYKRYNNLSLYDLVRILIRNLIRDNIWERASGVSFNFILATFPAIIFLFTLTPYIHQYFPNVNEEAIMEFLQSMMPASIYDVVSTTVLDIVSNQRGGLLTFGFLFSLFLATNGMMALMNAFNACYKTKDKRNPFKMRLTATGLTFMMAGSLLLVIVLLVIGQLILMYITTNISEFSSIELDDFTVYLLLITRFLIIFLSFFLAISGIYYFGPAVQKDWHFFSIGSFIATLGILGTCYGFSYYITNFGTYNKLYGSIGALIAMMVWIQLLTTVLLFGYELNASIHYGRQRLKKGKRIKVFS